MPKLKADLEALRVESFATAAPARKDVVAVAMAPSYPDPVYTCAYHCTWIGVTCE